MKRKQGQPKVVVIDDDPNFAKGLSEVIRSDYPLFDVFDVGMKRDAIKLIEVFWPDVLLIDLHLPDGTGLDIISHAATIARKRKIRTPKMLIVTGQGTIDTVLEALKRGAVDYLLKPIDYARVKAVLNIFRK